MDNSAAVRDAGTSPAPAVGLPGDPGAIAEAEQGNSVVAKLTGPGNSPSPAEAPPGDTAAIAEAEQGNSVVAKLTGKDAEQVILDHVLQSSSVTSRLTSAGWLNRYRTILLRGRRPQKLLLQCRRLRQLLLRRRRPQKLLLQCHQPPPNPTPNAHSEKDLVWTAEIEARISFAESSRARWRA